MTFKPVDAHPDFVKLEEDLLKRWHDQGIVKKYLAKNKASKKKFSFLDGPITANNPMGVHHARGRTYKDLWQRYKTMQGFNLRYQNGFDCQGLWVEVEVEKELGFKSKKDVIAYGVEKFVNKCKERVLKYAAIQTEQSKRLGMWMDWDHSYFTMSDENNYAIWNFLKVCHDRGWIYKGHDSVPWCPRCETAISQHEMLTEDYGEVTHDSIYFTLPLTGKKDEYLLVWTTTPWTLPANIAVAVDAGFTYALAEVKSGQKYWLLKELVEPVLGEDLVKIVKTVKGKDLVGVKYQTAFDDLPAVKDVADKNPDKFHLVVATDSRILPISQTDGTGMVHTAVSAGTEDFSLGKKLGLPMIPVIADNADYLEGFVELSGKNAKKQPELVFNYLKLKSGHWLYKIAPYKHRYPACWRCKTELVWKVTDEWYIAMDKADPTDSKKRTLRQEIMDVTKKINWIPGFGLERELDWLKNMHDWLISKKNRFWGLALPIYECSKCGNFEVVGGKDELKKRAVSGWDKFAGHTPHKPWIDEVKIKCGQCGKAVSRIEPVGNPWLDAGIVPFSTLPDGWFPAEFITEAFPGQFKNWFYAMLVMSTVLRKTNPYQTVLGYETVVGEDGRPMHKSWGNSIEFNEGASKIGVDVMRWLYSRALPTQVLPFGYTPAGEIRRQFVLILWNSYRFFVSLAEADGWKPGKNTIASKHVLDQWILSRLNHTITTVTKSLDEYYSGPATVALEELVSDFSTWYIRRSRDRLTKDTFQTMHQVLIKLSLMLAPFTPYLADLIYTNLTGEISVHLADWPKVDKKYLDVKLEADMVKAREVVEKAHAQRKALGIILRQPLASLATTTRISNSDLIKVVSDEINVKQIKFVSKGEEKFDTKLTPELKAEGQARDIARLIQEQRKNLGTKLDQLVDVQLPDWPKSFEGYIKKKTLIRNLKRGSALKVWIVA